MTITAEIIADSVNDRGIRITTFRLRYPRYIHAERLRHRILSCSVASSRAIPTKRMIEDIERDPVIPVEWGANQAGMSAGAPLTEAEAEACKHVWYTAKQNAVDTARVLLAKGLHKQWVSRILEPFAHCTEIVTGTSWGNWYALRMHPKAMPEIRELATKMHALHTTHVPTLRVVDRAHDWASVLFTDGYAHDPTIINAWHLPLVTEEERAMAVWGGGNAGVGDMADALYAAGQIGLDELGDRHWTLADLVCMSIGRCARTSYLTHDGTRDPAADIDLAKRCIADAHWSPTEHQAPPAVGSFIGEWIGNFKDWHQCRKMFSGEHPYDSTAIPWDALPAATPAPEV